MLTIKVGSEELFNSEDMTFSYSKPIAILNLEHSLVSITKWEARWGKAYLADNDKTDVEILDYIRCMTINKNVASDVYQQISTSDIQKITEYINHPMTATIIKKEENKLNREIITNEIIYYWMTALNIPFECEKWHLNRLLMLVDVCNIKNSPQKKKSPMEAAKERDALNRKRLREMEGQ